MLKIYIQLNLLILPLFVFSQNTIKIDSIINNYPKSFKNINEISNKLKSDFSDEIDYSYATYIWIVKNINYDINSQANSNPVLFSYITEKERIAKEKKTINDLAEYSISKNSGVCHNFASLFNEICTRNGIKSTLILGNLKSSPDQIGEELDINHAWNYLKINNKEIIVDCTLGATIKNKSITDEFYFNPKPELFYLNHYPLETKIFSSIYPKSTYQNFPLFYEYYYNAGFKLSNSLVGFFSSNESNEVKLFFENVNYQTDYFSCYFQSSKTKVELNKNNDSDSFTILLKNNESDFITIYANYKALLTIRITK
jgi:transglutaminase/protease-like cytokinesis protein 3